MYARPRSINFALWVEATRPKTLFAALSPLIMGLAIALERGMYNLPLFLWTMVTAMLIQILTNLANDYFDFLKGADTQTRIGPRRLLQTGDLTTQHLKTALVVITLLIAILLIPLVWRGGSSIIFLGLVALALAYGYTAGPFALAYTGWGDIAVLLGFGPVALSSIVYLQTLQWDLVAACIGLIPGSLSTAILVANNLRDHESDTLAHKQTLVVRWGRAFGKGEYCALIALPLALTLFFGLYWVSLVGGFFAFPLMYRVCKAQTAQDFVPFLGKTALFNFCYCILFALGWCL